MGGGAEGAEEVKRRSGEEGVRKEESKNEEDIMGWKANLVIIQNMKATANTNRGRTQRTNKSATYDIINTEQARDIKQINKLID